MDRSIIIHLAIALYCLQFCESCQSPSNKDCTIITIIDLSREQKIALPMQCKGWCIRARRVVLNTANDTILLDGDKFFAPGQTGKIFTMEGYGIQADTFTYVPYKANLGKVIVEGCISNCRMT